MTRSMAPILGIACLLFAARPASAADYYREKIYGLSVEIPDHWHSVAPEVVTQINSTIARFLNAKISYLTCLVPAGHTSAELPRILIQFQPWDGGIPTYEAIEDTLKNDVRQAIGKIKKDSSIPLRSLEVGDASLDRKSNRIMMRMQSSVPGDGLVQGLSIGILGKQGVVFLHCYAKDEKFRRTAPLFEYFADTFKWEAGKEYNPAEATVTAMPHSGSRDQSNSFSWFSASRGGMYGAIIGGGVGALALAARFLRRRLA